MPSALKGQDFLRLGRQPRQAGLFEHVVKRQEAPHEYFRGRNPAAIR